jgi:SnoaL-like protein
MTSDRLHGKESAMDEQNGQALDVALAYHDAWTSKDLERAMTYVADDIVCDAPAGRIEGAEAYRAFMGPFVQILKRAELIAAFGDDRTAIVVYDTETMPVHSAPGAECVTVEDGRIVYSRFIFDRAPFDAARANAG